MAKSSVKVITDALRGTRLFAAADESELQIIASDFCTERTFKKGETIFSRNSAEKCVGVILKGAASVKKEYVVISRLEAGDLFGAVTLYNKQSCFVNDIIADCECKVVFVSRAAADMLISQNPEFAKSFIEYLSQRIYFLNAKIEAYTQPTADDKLFSFLKDVAKGESELCLSLKMTELAKALNLSRASLYRAFDELSEQGRIIKDGKNIKFL